MHVPSVCKPMMINWTLRVIFMKADYMSQHSNTSHDQISSRSNANCLACTSVLLSGKLSPMLDLQQLNGHHLVGELVRPV